MNEIPPQSNWAVPAPASLGEVTGERAFIRSTFGWMFSGLLLTALVALAVTLSPALLQLVGRTPFLFFGIGIAELGMVWYLSARIRTLAPGTAAALFFLYSALNGVTLSVYLAYYSHASVASAFVTAAGMFGAMSLFGLATKRDLTSWGSFFFMGLIGIVIASVVNMFLRSSGLDFVISVLGVFIFVGLTAYDTQKLKAYSRAGGGTNLAIIGALSLYLDFINLFLMLLRLFGGRRR